MIFQFYQMGMWFVITLLALILALHLVVACCLVLVCGAFLLPVFSGLQFAFLIPLLAYKVHAIYPLELLGGQLISWEISLQLAEMALHHVKHAGKNGVATIEFDQQVDAFEFEDSSHIEAQVERLLSAGLAHFAMKGAHNS